MSVAYDDNDVLILAARDEYSLSLVKGQKLGEKGKYRIYDEMGNFYALYYYDRKAGCYKCEKMFFGA